MIYFENSPVITNIFAREIVNKLILTTRNVCGASNVITRTSKHSVKYKLIVFLCIKNLKFMDAVSTVI